MGGLDGPDEIAALAAGIAAIEDDALGASARLGARDAGLDGRMDTSVVEGAAVCKERARSDARDVAGGGGRRVGS